MSWDWRGRDGGDGHQAPGMRPRAPSAARREGPAEELGADVDRMTLQEIRGKASAPSLQDILEGVQERSPAVADGDQFRRHREDGGSEGGKGLGPSAVPIASAGRRFAPTPRQQTDVVQAPMAAGALRTEEKALGSENGPRDVILMKGWVKRVLPGSVEELYGRFLCLRGKVLSIFSDEAMTQKPLWEINIEECPVSAGLQPKELVIHLHSRDLVFLTTTDAECAAWLRAVRIATSENNIRNRYEIQKFLGAGSFAQVFLAIDRQTGQKVAIKQIFKQRCNVKQLEFLKRETAIAKACKHEHITALHELIDTESVLYLVLEYMPGGELFNIIASAGYFSELTASLVMRDIISGVSYLHTHGIVHRDLKPENLLCKSKEWPLNVKVADFGLAGFVDEVDDRGTIGTLAYMAPEVVRHVQYGPAVDMWSCGVILYIMLSGKMPFYGRTDQECVNRITHGAYAFPKEQWGSISSEAILLIRGLLQVDPNKRLTAKAALNHRWITGCNLPETNIPNDLSAISVPRLTKTFRRAAFAVLSIRKLATLASQAHVPDGSKTRTVERCEEFSDCVIKNLCAEFGQKDLILRQSIAPSQK